MRGFILFLMLLVGTVQLSFGQATITGTVVDATEKTKLENAAVMLLRAKDSLLIDYIRTDAAGKFQLKRPADGDFIIVVSYPKYADFSKVIPEMSAAASVGEIGLSSVAHLIDEVVVKGRAAITIKGDTTEYDASSFKTEKNAKVEDLLKVLPGITVDATGKITAQGKVVKKVLVDGEEFFGNDPLLVTRNLRSDMVDKVQVYEKKSEQAERTGVDDGERQQTINVKLKEDAKNGIFGKALAGAGTDKYYMGQLMFNKFKGSQKISAYGLLGNNATTSLSQEDAEKYAGDSGVSYSDEGSFSFSSGNDPFSGNGSIGIPRAISTGVNFADRFKGDKHKMNLSYKYGRIASEGNDNMEQTGVLINSSKKYIDAENSQHNINLRYDWNIDSLNQFTVRANAQRKMIWNTTDLNSSNYDNNGNLTLDNRSVEVVDNKLNTYAMDLMHTLKFAKKGRSLTLNVGANKDETNGGGSLKGVLKNIHAGDSTLTDQLKNREQDITTLRGSVTYTEPLSKALNLGLGAGIEDNKNTSLVESWNKGASGEYDELDNRFSSNFDYHRISSNYRVSLNYTTEKLRIGLNNNLNNDRLNQTNLSDDASLQRSFKRTFFTYNPRLNAGYSLAKNKYIWLNYQGRNQLPSLNQIQPILNNSDPLNFYEGNEALKPAFNHNLNLGMYTFDVFSGSNLYAGGNASITKSPIAQNITRVDNVNYYRWSNIEGKTNKNFSLWSGYYFKLNKDLGLANQPQLNVSYGEFNNFVNSAQNLVKTSTYSFTYNFIRDTKTGLNFNVNLTPQYRKMTSNLEPDRENSGFVFASNGSVEYFFAKTFKIYANYDYSYEAKTKSFDTKLERFLVHPGISKKFLKNESLMVDFIINDVLNQNIGYSRSQSNSVFTQRRFDTIRRYYMVKVSWDFNKMFVK